MELSARMKEPPAPAADAAACGRDAATSGAEEAPPPKASLPRLARRLVCVLRLISLGRRWRHSAASKAAGDVCLEDSPGKDEHAFIKQVLGCPPLMRQAFGLLRPFFEDGEEQAMEASLAAQAIHKAKVATARVAWKYLAEPLRLELEQAKHRHEALQTQFNGMRREYLKEVSSLRSESRVRGDPESLLGRDVTFFFEPMNTLLPDELAYASSVVNEKLKMIFETNPKVSTMVDFGQVEKFKDIVLTGEADKLREALAKKAHELTEMREERRRLQRELAQASITARSRTSETSSSMAGAAVMANLEDKLRQVQEEHRATEQALSTERHRTETVSFDRNKLAKELNRTRAELETTSSDLERVRSELHSTQRELQVAGERDIVQAEQLRRMTLNSHQLAEANAALRESVDKWRGRRGILQPLGRPEPQSDAGQEEPPLPVLHELSEAGPDRPPLPALGEEEPSELQPEAPEAPATPQALPATPQPPPASPQLPETPSSSAELAQPPPAEPAPAPLATARAAAALTTAMAAATARAAAPADEQAAALRQEEAERLLPPGDEAPASPASIGMEAPQPAAQEATDEALDAAAHVLYNGPHGQRGHGGDRPAGLGRSAVSSGRPAVSAPRPSLTTELVLPVRLDPDPWRAKLLAAVPGRGAWAKLWRRADQTGKGRLAAEEFSGLLRNEAKISARDIPEHAVQAVFKAVDVEKAESVSFGHFGSWLGLPEEERRGPRGSLRRPPARSPGGLEAEAEARGAEGRNSVERVQSLLARLHDSVDGREVSPEETSRTVRELDSEVSGICAFNAQVTGKLKECAAQSVEVREVVDRLNQETQQAVEMLKQSPALATDVSLQDCLAKVQGVQRATDAKSADVYGRLWSDSQERQGRIPRGCGRLQLMVSNLADDARDSDPEPCPREPSPPPPEPPPPLTAAAAERYPLAVGRSLRAPEAKELPPVEGSESPDSPSSRLAAERRRKREGSNRRRTVAAAATSVATPAATTPTAIEVALAAFSPPQSRPQSVLAVPDRISQRMAAVLAAHPSPPGAPILIRSISPPPNRDSGSCSPAQEALPPRSRTPLGRKKQPEQQQQHASAPSSARRAPSGQEKNRRPVPDALSAALLMSPRTPTSGRGLRLSRPRTANLQPTPSTEEGGPSQPSSVASRERRPLSGYAGARRAPGPPAGGA